MLLKIQGLKCKVSTRCTLPPTMDDIIVIVGTLVDTWQMTWAIMTLLRTAGVWNPVLLELGPVALMLTGT